MCIMESGADICDNNYFIGKYLPERVERSTGAGGPSATGVDSKSSRQANIQQDNYYMPDRLRSRVGVWEELGANSMVLGWVNNGFMAWFHTECPYMSKVNQPSCFEPKRHLDFINDSIDKLLERGVVGRWQKNWGTPRVISPLKVVPKKGDKLRLILDLFRLNQYLMFPRFKYDNINKVGDTFRIGDYLFAWDLKDGYWHQELHPDMWQFMCFEWGGELLYFKCMPFGLAPACWVFTKLIRVMVDHWRARGLACLSYIDDGIGGARGRVLAGRMRDMVITTLLDAGWFINWEKSKFELAFEAEFIGYRVGTEGPQGYLEPSESRVVKLVQGVDLLLRARTVSARKVAQVAGYIVSLRPVFDPMALLFTKYMYMWISKTTEVRGWDYRLELGEEVRVEVRVWKTWWSRWVRKPLWSGGAPPVWVQAQDASDDGVGGWLGHLGGLEVQNDKKGRGHIVGFPREFLEAVGKLDKWDREQSSTYRELFALFFMIDSFKELVRGSSILIQADNRALYFICSSGRTSVLVIHTLLVKLFWLCLDYSIAWDIVWLPRELNRHADELSKFVDPDDWGLGERAWREVNLRFGPFDCDRFAAAGNRLLDCFCALHWCPGVWFVDCYSRGWGDGFSWWHPNPREVPRILAKVRLDKARGALLLPLWPGAWWWLKVCPDGRHLGDLIRGWMELDLTRDLMVRGPSGNFWSKEIPRARVLVMWLDGSQSQGFVEGRLGFCALGGCEECRITSCFR